MIKAVIFDMDDTLISEYEYIKSGYQAVAEYLATKYEFQKSIVYSELMNIFHNDSKMVFNQWFELHQIAYERDDVMKLVEVYRKHTPAINFFEDVIPCLQSLKGAQIKTGIISDGYLDTQSRKAEVLEAENYFDKVILTDELGREFWKPHVKAFEIMRDCLGVTFEEMMYVGDNPQKDFYMKKEIPITTVRIDRNNGVYLDREYRENIREDYRINTLTKLVEIL